MGTRGDRIVTKSRVACPSSGCDLGFAACLEKCDLWGFRKESFLKSFTLLTTRHALSFQECKLEVCSRCVSVLVCACVMYACVFVGVCMYVQVHTNVCVNVCVYMYLLGWLEVHSGFIRSYRINLNEPLGQPDACVCSHSRTRISFGILCEDDALLSSRSERRPRPAGSQRRPRRPRLPGNER